MNALHITASKPTSLLLAAILLLDLGPATWRAMEQVDLMLAQISLELCEIGITIVRVFGN